MLTEVMVDSAVKAVVGSGFSELVKRVFAGNQSSDRELIQHLVEELRRINSHRIPDIENRLAILEAVVQGYSHALTAPTSGKQFFSASIATAPLSAHVRRRRRTATILCLFFAVFAEAVLYTIQAAKSVSCMHRPVEFAVRKAF